MVSNLTLPTGYFFEEELDSSRLNEYSEHRRLSFLQSRICDECGKLFPRLIIGKQKTGGGVHVDLYSENLDDFLTLGHIIPKRCGGLVEKENIRPLCFACNKAEGLRIPDKLIPAVRERIVGRVAKCKNSLIIISQIKNTPKTTLVGGERLIPIQEVRFEFR